MPPPISSVSTLLEQIIDDLDFVGDFGAPKDRDEWLLWIFERLAQIRELLLHQQTGGRLLHEVRDAFRRGMGAMRAAKGVVHIDIAQAGELLRESRDRSLLLRRWKRRFSSSSTWPDSSCRAISVAMLAHAIRREGHIDRFAERVGRAACAADRRPAAGCTSDSACPWGGRGARPESPWPCGAARTRSSAAFP